LPAPSFEWRRTSISNRAHYASAWRTAPKSRQEKLPRCPGHDAWVMADEPAAEQGMTKRSHV
jgi:hypothetical protein